MVKEVITTKTVRDASDIAKLEAEERALRKGTEEERREVNDILSDVTGGDESGQYFKVYKYKASVSGKRKFGYVTSLTIEDFKAGGEEFIKQGWGGGQYQVVLFNKDDQRIRGGTRDFLIEGEPKSTHSTPRLREEPPRDSHEGGNGEIEYIEVPVETPPPPLDPLALSKEIRSAIREGIEFARSVPEAKDTGEVMKSLGDTFSQMAKMMTTTLSTLEAKRADIAGSEQALGKKFFEIMEHSLQQQLENQNRTMTQQVEHQNRLMEMSNLIMEQKIALAETKAKLSGEGILSSETSWMDVVIKLVDLVKERGPEFIGAFQQGIADGIMKQQGKIPLSTSPPILSGIKIEESALTKESSSSLSIPKVEKEEEGEEGLSLIEVVEGAIQRAFAQRLDYTDLFRCLALLAEPTELAELLGLYQKKEFLPEFYEGDMGNYTQKFIEFLVNLHKSVQEVPSAVTNPPPELQ